jgi:hypothetical protein
MRLRGPQGGLNDIESQAVKNIRAGDTQHQLKRAQHDKMMIGLPIAGATVAGGALQGYQSSQLQDKQKAKREQQLRFEGDKARSIEDKATRASAQQYAAPDYQQQQPAAGEDFRSDTLGNARPVPQWLEAQHAQANIGVNASAQATKLGGYTTKPGRDYLGEQSDMLTRDIATGKGMMQSVQQVAPMNMPQPGDQQLRNEVMGPQPNNYPAPAVPSYIHDPESEYLGR